MKVCLIGLPTQRPPAAKTPSNEMHPLAEHQATGSPPSTLPWGKPKITQSSTLAIKCSKKILGP